MAQCRVEQGDFRGWRAAYLKNDLVTLVAVPDLGGRIMAYDLGPYPYLYVDRPLAGKLFSPEENQGDSSLAAWKNYGGDKTWPAPQGWDTDDQWHGPPDSILDTGRYRLDALNGDGATATVRMVSPVTSPTGIEITRQVSLHAQSTRVTLDLSFRNVSQRTVHWSIWDVVQLRAERTTSDGCLTHEPGCIVTTPLNPASRFPKGYYVMFGDPANPQWGSDPDQGLFYGHYKWEVGKVGLDSRAGWAAFANTSAGYAFAVQFTTFPDQKYPDNGAGVEFWTVGRGQVANLDYEKSDIYLMECEVLSPFQHIAPGQTASFQIEWGAGRCTGPVVDVAEAGCASRKLHIERQGEYALIDGAFSVFDLGQLELKWIDRAGREIECVDLGPASPLAAVSIDRVCRVPAGAAEARLVVNAGDVSRGLACASL